MRRVVLVGIRRGYPEGDVAGVLRSLLADPGSCLPAFYARCFYPSQMAAYRRFRSGLQPAYLREMDPGVLRDGLSYLADARLSGEALPACPVAIVHGEEDVVAPLAAAGRRARRFSRGRFPRGGRRWLTPASCAASTRAQPGTRPTRTRNGSPHATCWRTPWDRSNPPPLDAFRGASVFGVDISEAMVRVAKRRIDDPRVRFAVADAEEIATGCYDLVTSNATFQWFLSLPRTLARMASLLPGGGVLTFSFFGPETYAELDAAMRASARRQGGEEGARVAAAGFHSREEIAGALSAAF
ncbi:MAG: Methyltransferase type 12, partial [Deltaproteobacteria bacterium]|nr:Methyltransferase type 12 [Deltaproteobacteria bacterium]